MKWDIFAVQAVMPNDHSKQDQHNQRKQLKRCDHTDTNKEDHIETRDDDETKVVMSTDDHLKQGVQSNRYDSLDQEQNYRVGSINRIDYDGQGQSGARGMQQIDDLGYYDSNSDDDNEDNGDTFHDSIQAEDMIDDTYNDDDDVNRKPTNNVIDHGEQRLKLYIINYAVSAKLEWCFKTCHVNNTKFNQKKKTKEDEVYWIPDPLDHLDNISSIPDLYSNKQMIQPYHRLLKHVYNRMTYYGEQ